MKAESVLSIVDISSNEFTSIFIEWIVLNVDATYQDTVLTEHIYNIEDMMQYYDWLEDDVTPNNQDIIRQLDEVIQLLNDNQASYFRIIYA